MQLLLWTQVRWTRFFATCMAHVLGNHRILDTDCTLGTAEQVFSIRGQGLLQGPQTWKVQKHLLVQLG